MRKSDVMCKAIFWIQFLQLGSKAFCLTQAMKDTTVEEPRGSILHFEFRVAIEPR